MIRVAAERSRSQLMRRAVGRRQREGGRGGSRSKALFMKPRHGEKGVGVINRFLPGLTDHSMTGYEHALSKKIGVRCKCRVSAK